MTTRSTVRGGIFARTVAAAGLSLACALGAAPAQAAATHYDISFTGSVPAGSLPTGGFDYDASTPTFSNFHVLWNGGDFDLTLQANNPVFAGTSFNSGTGFTCTDTGVALSFKLLSKDACLGSVNKKWEIFFFLGGGGTAMFDFDLKDASADFFFTSQQVTMSVPSVCTAEACGSGDWQIRAVEGTVPEPGSAALGALALAGLAVARRRRSRA